jgi:LysM domain
MSVMSAAVKREWRGTGRWVGGGHTAGTGQEILPPGPRMAAPATDQDGVGPEASPRDDRPAQTDHAASARSDRRLRLVTTEVHVTEVRVAREVSSSRVSAQRVGGLRRSAQRVRAEYVSAERVSVPGASARRVSMQRASAQRASAQRVSIRETSTQPGGLRLTRRGRQVLTGFVMLVIVISAMLIWTSVAGGAQAPSPGAPARSVYQGMAQIVVQPGQTLWSIAAAVDPSADPWTAVQQISDANALNGTQVQAGQLLWVPRG